jgi:hypothetical protein
MTSNYDTHNPYAAPAEATPVNRSLSRDEALARLRTPARWLVWMGVASVLYNLCPIVVMIVNGEPPGPPDQISPAMFVIWGTLFATLVLFQPLLVLIAGWKVAGGNIPGWVRVAIVAGLIPFAVCLQTPFAFWLLHLMLRKDIRAALAQTEDVHRGPPVSATLE